MLSIIVAMDKDEFDIIYKEDIHDELSPHKYAFYELIRKEYNMKNNSRELKRIQKDNNLNIIKAVGEYGPGNAQHIYQVEREDTKGIVATIQFQTGCREDSNSITGVLNTDLLEIVRDQLTQFQSGALACHNNEKALQHIEEALFWLSQRSADRADRNVLGKEEK